MYDNPLLVHWVKLLKLSYFKDAYEQVLGGYSSSLGEKPLGVAGTYILL
jgi:hypothetical protein